MLVIRLTRIGRKNKAAFRLVLQEKIWSPKSKALELLGSYNPHLNPPKPVLKAERIKYWISKGAQPSNTVNNLLINAGVITGAKKKVVKSVKKIEEKKEEPKAVEVKPEAKKEETKA